MICVCKGILYGTDRSLKSVVNTDRQEQNPDQCVKCMTEGQRVSIYGGHKSQWSSKVKGRHIKSSVFYKHTTLMAESPTEL